MWRFARIAWAGYYFSTQGISQPPSEEVALQYHASVYDNYRVFLDGAARGEATISMADNMIPLDISTFKHLYYRQYTNKQRIVKVILSFTILIIGGLIYVGFRDKSLLMFDWFEQLGISGEVDAFRGFVNSEGVYGWVKNSLPDGLWLFAYMFLVDAIWNGSMSICSYIFIYSLPVFALLSEFLQYFGLFPGVFDWIDVACYSFAILLYVIIKLIK